MSEIIAQYQHNTSRGPYYQPSSRLPASLPAAHPVRYVAYYLPQFHEIPENNKWWGPGFTEWTNVTKALPRYQGHFQPRLPGDLGFYDLSNIDHIRRQVALAKRAGIFGFCFHNYWFSGRTLLETPLALLLKHKDIDIGFCVNWANENWSRRWDGKDQEVLIKQDYAPGEDVKYAEYISRFLEDERYITINGRPLIMVYRPGHLPDARATVERWRNYFVKRGFPNPYVIMPQAFGDNDPRLFGMDAAAGFAPHKVGFNGPSIRHWVKKFNRSFTGNVVRYDDMVANGIAYRPEEFRYFPSVCPSWDNEARRPNCGFSLAGSSPAKYGAWLRAVSRTVSATATGEERIVFINAWNEWAEGAYLEPDRHHGYAYLIETRRALEEFAAETVPNRSQELKAESIYETPRLSYLSYMQAVQNYLLRRLLGAAAL